MKVQFIEKRLWHHQKKKIVICGQVWCRILRICALHLTHPSAHTDNRSSGQPLLRRPGFGALLDGLTSVVVSKVERTFVVHALHRQFLPDPRFKPTTSVYKSDALSIGYVCPKWTTSLCLKIHVYDPQDESRITNLCIYAALFQVR